MKRILIVATALLAAAACGEGSEAAAEDPLTEGRRLYQQHCAACHGDFGEGGVGRALPEVIAVFPDCNTQVTWIGLGSERWVEEIGPTYGALNRVPEGVMPSFESTLSEEERRLVAAYERSEFGGATEAAALAGCSVTAAG